MPKIPDCDRCLLYAKSPHLVCAIHPSGVQTENCPDFRANPNIQSEELWTPEGYYWYGEELIPYKRSRLTQEDRLQIAKTHPFFTGICSKCGYNFDLNNPPLVHWDCPQCGWIDDSVH
jgi:hypothetical protein